MGGKQQNEYNTYISAPNFKNISHKRFALPILIYVQKAMRGNWPNQQSGNDGDKVTKLFVIYCKFRLNQPNRAIS